MPTYAYRCAAGHEFEAVQGITEPALASCRACAAPVRRVVFPVGIVFKGRGFYKTDSRSSSSSSITPAAVGSKGTATATPAAASKDGGAGTGNKVSTPKSESASGTATPASGG